MFVTRFILLAATDSVGSYNVIRHPVDMHYMHPGYQTSIFGKNCAYYIRIFMVDTHRSVVENTSKAAFRWGRASGLKENPVTFDLTCLTAVLLGLPATRFCDLFVGDSGSSVVDGIFCADDEPAIHGCIRPSAIALQMATTISGHLCKCHLY